MSERLNQYLTQETAEYLDQLDELLSYPGAPDLQRLLTLARGVRGSAQMAGAETLTAVAERLEDAVRSVVSNQIVWSEEIRRLAAQTVRDLQVLVRALNRWGPAEESRVRIAIDRWEDLGSSAGEGIVPISSLFVDDEGPHVLFEGQPPVPIESLLLTGDGALQAALQLRPEVEEALRAGGVLDTPVGKVVGELFMLLGQARMGASARE